MQKKMCSANVEDALVVCVCVTQGGSGGVFHARVAVFVVCCEVTERTQRYSTLRTPTGKRSRFQGASKIMSNFINP